MGSLVKDGFVGVGLRELVRLCVDEGIVMTHSSSFLLSSPSLSPQVRALVFINPGNPTGQCLSHSNLEELVKLCVNEGIVMLADEVYQENVYQDERPFVSAHKVMHELGAPYSTALELVSYHTVSKGTYGECGQRGGYFQLSNFHPAVSE